MSNIAHECSLCLLNERLPNVVIGPDGLCEECRCELGRCQQRKVERAEFDQLTKDFVGTTTVVAFSGGSDSAAALILTKTKLRMNAIAVLCDNGFIPDDVKTRASHLCEALEVRSDVRPLHIEGLLTNAVVLSDTEATPCRLCIQSVFRAIDAAANTFGARCIVTGHKVPPAIYSSSVPALVSLLSLD